MELHGDKSGSNEENKPQSAERGAESSAVPDPKEVLKNRMTIEHLLSEGASGGTVGDPPSGERAELSVGKVPDLMKVYKCRMTSEPLVGGGAAGGAPTARERAALSAGTVPDHMEAYKDRMPDEPLVPEGAVGGAPLPGVKLNDAKEIVETEQCSFEDAMEVPMGNLSICSDNEVNDFCRMFRDINPTPLLSIPVEKPNFVNCRSSLAGPGDYVTKRTPRGRSFLISPDRSQPVGAASVNVLEKAKVASLVSIGSVQSDDHEVHELGDNHNYLTYDMLEVIYAYTYNNCTVKRFSIGNRLHIMQTIAAYKVQLYRIMLEYIPTGKDPRCTTEYNFNLYMTKLIKVMVECLGVCCLVTCPQVRSEDLFFKTIVKILFNLSIFMKFRNTNLNEILPITTGCAYCYIYNFQFEVARTYFRYTSDMVSKRFAGYTDSQPNIKSINL